MNLEKLRQQDDEVMQCVDTWPLSKLLRIFQVLKNRGMSSDDIDHRIVYEFKREEQGSG